jgi:hypothetical protein
MVRQKAERIFLGTHLASRTNKKRGWQAKPKIDWKEINLTIQVVRAHIFLERVLKKDFLIKSLFIIGTKCLLGVTICNYKQHGNHNFYCSERNI